MVKKDISRQTLTVLVFLAILVTLIGTMTVTTEVAKVKLADQKAPADNSQTHAKVMLNVKNPGTAGDTSSGVVKLDIQQPNDG